LKTGLQLIKQPRIYSPKCNEKMRECNTKETFNFYHGEVLTKEKE
jgi:hypothetical protein